MTDTALAPDIQRWIDMGRAQVEIGQYDAALQAFEHVPGHLGYNLRGVTLGVMGRHAEALSACSAAALEFPCAPYWGNVGGLLVQLTRFQDAIEYLERAVAADPALVTVHENLGLAYLRLGDTRRSATAYRAGMRRGSQKAHQNLIFLMDYLADTTPGDAYRLRRQYNTQYAAGQAAEHTPPRTALLGGAAATGPVRVGYIGSDFQQHSAARCFAPVLLNHTKAVEPFIYSGTPMASHMDGLYRLFRRALPNWRSIWGWTTDEIVNVIRADALDILVDLGGYTKGNFLEVLSRRPAPIQVTAWGHAHGTGLDTVDYLFGDEWATPSALEPFIREQVWRLPSIVPFFHQEWMDALEPGPLPYDRNGYITFGSFNRHIKVSPETLDMWAQILLAVPTARLILKDNGGWTVPDVRERISDAFSARGVDIARITIYGKTTHADHLLVYQHIDIALDPYPHGGGVTALEGLWMGVPMITRKGEWIPTRLGYSFWRSLDPKLALQFVAETVSAYVGLAEAWAQNTEELRNLRATLRETLRSSPLLDCSRYVNEVETAYRAMIDRRCADANP